MIDPVRQEILSCLDRLSEAEPEVRFGQLIANMAFLVKGPWNETLWDLEDDDLLDALKKRLADLACHEPAAV